MIFSIVIFFLCNFISIFCASVCVGNMYAIYSEVNLPEDRGLVNSVHGMLVQFGGVIGNLIIFFMVSDMASLTVAVIILLTCSLVGSFFWVLPFKFYAKEAQELREVMEERKNS